MSPRAARSPIARLEPMTAGVIPISDAERRARIDRAQRLMAENQLDAMVIEPGSSMFYFTGVEWGLSERVFVMVLPAKGDIVWVCPKFEEDRALELVRFGHDIRTWHEDESPYKVLAGILRDLAAWSGRVALEERVRFLLVDGMRQEAPAAHYVSADAVTIACRSIKSAAEIALMQRANDITVEAYKAVLAMLREGMTKAEFMSDSVAAFAALGVVGRIGANFGEHSALPHGSSRPRALRPGDVVLMDGGCSVEGYRSDISRTIVFGPPNQRYRDVWEVQLAAQRAAFEAARPGVAHEDIDAAARQVIVEAGYGPGYDLPGLPHRLGHGIGLDGHEWTYLVKGNKAPVKPGMCFTNEPTIVLPGEFGIRQEDDIYITSAGARWFTQPMPAIDQPFVGA